MVDISKLAELEALLYAASRPLSLTQIVTQLKLENELEASYLLDKLSSNYLEDNSALEIRRLPQDKVVLQLKHSFTKPASKVSMKPFLTEGSLKTLSYIAYNQPVLQTDVALARGSQAYKHLKALSDMGLIKREKEGRTKIVTTTQDFADYLGLSVDRTSMRRQLRSLFRRLELHQMEKK
jgi:segregation and condensation protein B